MNTLEIDSKGTFSKIGFSITIIMLLRFVVQQALVEILKVMAPNILDSQWLNNILLVAGYLVALPVFCIMTKGVTSDKKKLRKDLNIGQIVMAFLIVYAFKGIFNLATILIMAIISMIKGGQVNNPITNILSNSNIIGTVIVTIIVAPIIEEFIFRKVILDKLRVYGDKIAIITTALLFGLFHANVAQFFYVTAMGLVLGYIAMKTNSIKYTIIIHMMVNMMGAVIATGVLKTPMELGIFELANLAFIIIGIVLFLKNKKKIVLSTGDVTVEKGKVFKTVALNPGMIVYFVLSMLYTIVRLVK